MATRPFLLLTVAVASVLAAATALQAATVPSPKQALLQGQAGAARVAPEQKVSRLIVKLRNGAAIAPTGRALGLRRLVDTTGVELDHVRDLAGDASLVLLGAPVPLSEAKRIAARLALDPSVEYVDPDVLFKRTAVPTEPRYAQWQWNLFPPTQTYTGGLLGGGSGSKSAVAVGGANLPPAWDITQGGPATIVAVIDTGIVNHPDLNGITTPAAPYVPSGRFVAGYDFVSSDVGAAEGLPPNFTANDGDGRDPDPTDPGDWVTTDEEARYPSSCDDGSPGPQSSSWHGTHMAGIVAATANNGIGIAGIGWNVRVQPVRALGKCGGSLSDIAEAIRWAAGLPVPGVPANATPASVISLSLGGSDTCSASMQSAVDAAIATGAVVVAATGNEESSVLISPASCNGVISVTAHTIKGENADYANIGAKTTLSAPGGGRSVGAAANDPTADSNWSGYYIWSTLLYGATDPASVDAQGRSGPAYGGFTGTSAAAPHVAGVAALIKSVLPTANASRVRSFLVNNVRPYAASSACAPEQPLAGLCGAGLLDAGAAVGDAVRSAPPVILTGPQSVTVSEGQSASLAVSAAGAGTLAYQWKRNGVDIPGATSSTYTTPALSTGDSGTRYSVTVTNALGSATSAEAVVTVAPAGGGPVSPPTGGGGGGALPLGQVLVLALLALGARIRRRE